MPFIGRNAELERLVGWLREGERLVTVKGAAGVGKSSLINAARAQEPDLLSAACWIDATEHRMGETLFEAIAAELGVGARSADDPSLLRALDGGPRLIVIDNAEHLREPIAAALRDWYDAAPELQVLVASRASFELPFERVLPLEPFALTEDLTGPAAKIFLSTLERRAPGAASEAAADPHLGRLLEALDGLPLAIELAASRAVVHSISELLDRVQRGASIDDDGENQRRSLRTAMEVSWELLDADERQCLAQLSVFADGFEADSAEALAGPHALRLIERLHGCSLIERRSGGRLFLLLTVKQFAAAQQDHAEESRRRHLVHFAELADKLERDLSGPKPEKAGERLRAERANLRLAAEWGLAQQDVEARVLALRAFAGLRMLHRLDGAGVSIGLQLMPVLSDPLIQARAPRLVHRLLLRLAFDQVIANKPEKGEPILNSLAELAVPEEDRWNEVVPLATLDMLRGDEENGIARIEALLARESLTSRLRFDAHAYLVELHRQAGRGLEARRHGQAALQFADQTPALDRAPLLTGMSFAATESGVPSLGAGFANMGLNALDSVGARRTRTRTALELAEARAIHAAGDAVRALTRYEILVPICQRTSQPQLEMYVRLSTASALLDLDRFAEAHVALNQIAFEGGSTPYAIAGLAILSVLEAAMGSAAEATRLAAQVEDFQDLPFAPYALPCTEVARAVASGATATSLINSHLESLRLVRQAPIETGAVVRLLESVRDGRVVPGVAVPVALASDGSWFDPASGAPVDCGKRPIMRRVLKALVAQYSNNPQRSLSRDEVLAAGWPGERMSERSARRRVEVMVSRIRELGLRNVLETTAEGYRLAPDTPVRIRIA